jgi:cell wall-associated NlpC family hydrolase
VVEGLGARAWTAAQRLIGVRFRLHGRDPASGLDCVGLVVAAYRAAGLSIDDVPDRYRLSGPAPDVARDWLAACGARAVTDAVRAGDILLADLGAGAQSQLHLLLLGPDGAVHAHAGLRRVVWSPAVPGRPVGRWRLC